MSAKLFTKNGERLTLHRQPWSETSNPLIAEARAQTLAIQRLQIWLRLAYSVLALAVLLGYWGFVEGKNLIAGVLGAVLGVISLLVVIILRTGINNGRQNVQAMLDHVQSTMSSAHPNDRVTSS